MERSKGFEPLHVCLEGTGLALSDPATPEKVRPPAIHGLGNLSAPPRGGYGLRGLFLTTSEQRPIED